MTDKVTDPVCGMQIDPDAAVASEEHDGQVFYFCGEHCHQVFLADPQPLRAPRIDHPSGRRGGR
ncbi:MAG TPA: YHS domain-containing protein [Acidimicrobiia bacterium]|nr:YHS domain-containing protein [Acidimicrobiia bacterium]